MSVFFWLSANEADLDSEGQGLTELWLATLVVARLGRMRRGTAGQGGATLERHGFPLLG